jgi:hypothetical protein
VSTDTFRFEAVCRGQLVRLGSLRDHVRANMLGAGKSVVFDNVYRQTVVDAGEVRILPTAQWAGRRRR